MTLPHKIECMCREKGMTFVSIERRAGLSVKGLYKVNPNTSALTLCKIAQLLGTTVEELLEGCE